MVSKTTQALHCLQLAEFLENLSSRKYNHSAFSNECGTVCCALGWAAQQGIGGLKNPQTPTLYTRSSTFYYDDAADRVFGNGAYDRIFGGVRPEATKGEPRSNRKLSIHRLRVQALELLNKK